MNGKRPEGGGLIKLRVLGDLVSRSLFFAVTGKTTPQPSALRIYKADNSLAEAVFTRISAIALEW